MNADEIKVLCDEALCGVKQLAHNCGGFAKEIQFTLRKDNSNYSFLGERWNKVEARAIETQLIELGFKKAWESDFTSHQNMRFEGNNIIIYVEYTPDEEDKLRAKIEELQKLSGKKVLLEEIPQPVSPEDVTKEEN